MGDREFYVIQFKEFPVLDLIPFVCVPKTWIKEPFEGALPQSQTVYVHTRYPLLKPAEVRSLARNYKVFSNNWNIFYGAYLKYKTNKYEDAWVHIRGLLRRTSELTNITSERPSTLNNSKTVLLKPKKSKPANGEVSSPESPIKNNATPKRKYTRKPKKNDCKKQTPRGNDRVWKAVNDNAILIKTIAQDIQELKQNLFDSLIPTVLELQAANLRNSMNIENIQQSMATHFSYLLSKIEVMEKDKSENTISLIRNVKLVDEHNPPKIYETIANVSNDAIEKHVEQREIRNNAKTIGGNNSKGIDDAMATTSKYTTLTTEGIDEVETRITTEENIADTIEEPNTDDCIIISEEEEITAEVETVDNADTVPPARNGMKRTLVDADPCVLPIKRNVQSNHTSNDGHTHSEPTLNNGTAPEFSEFKQNTHNLETFLNDAFNFLSLYKKC